MGVFFVFGFSVLHAAGPVLELIDIPTAETLERYGYDVGFRGYSGGGVLTKAQFGVFPRLNVGVGLDVDGFVGSEALNINKPTINARFRCFDGRRNLPALAIGYDGQGLFYDDETDKYREREKGLYAVGSGEILLPGLGLHGGGNIYDFKDDHVYGFLGLNYVYEDLVGVTVEWDNIRVGRDSRLNTGLQWWISPSFSATVAARDLAGPRRSERIVRLSYSGGF